MDSKIIQISNNSLNTVRMLAAFQVMIGHLLDHYNLSICDDASRIIMFFRGVPIFFVISGFLMWFSIGRSNTYRQYLKKRFLRIYPELWVAVIFGLLVIIILYHKWNVIEMLIFAFTQSTIFQFYTPESLRGYGVGVPNGTLWTIGVMIQTYVVTWHFYKYMSSKSINTWLYWGGIAFVISWLIGYLTHILIDNVLIGKIYDQSFVKYYWLFYFGMFIANYKDMLLPVLQKYWFLLLITAFLFYCSGYDLYSGYYLFWSVFLTSALIGFAYRFPQLNLSHDISYGIFLYHMIVVNVFVNYNRIGWQYVIPTVIITILLAVVSTFTIGRWAALRKQINIT